MRVLVALLSVMVSSTTWAAGEERLSLEDCVQIALKQNHSLLRAEAALAEATAGRRSARGRYLPLIRIDANVMRWDKAAEVAFIESDGSAPALPPPATPYEAALAGMLAGFSEPLTVRERVTSSVGITAVQPITGLWGVYELHRIQSLGEVASTHQHQAAVNDAVLAVADAYYQALKLEQLAEIAELSVRQIEAHLGRARAYHETGLIGRNQLLEAEVRLAEAQAGLIGVRGGVTLSRSNLAFQIGMPADQVVFPKPVPDAPVVAVEETYEVAVARAVEARPELAAVDARREQAEAGTSAAWSQMVPQVSALASYQHVEGNSFAETDSYFIGGQLSWNVWEWGASYYSIDQAKARARQAELGLQQLREGVRLEVRKAFVELHSALQQLEVARRAVTQAEENLRIAERRFDANAATSTEVLDAVALEARAKVSKTTAYYDYLRVSEALKRALGQTPVIGAGNNNGNGEGSLR